MSNLLAHHTCLLCGSHKLQPLINISQDGIPHGTPDHNFVYGYRLIAACDQCQHGQHEKHSHDCFSHYEDEDWEMYWWYALSPESISQLRTLLAQCPNPLNTKCPCTVHANLRYDSERLWGDVRYVTSPHPKLRFAWAQLIEIDQQMRLKADKEKGIWQAVQQNN